MTTMVQTLRTGLEALGLVPSGTSRQLAEKLIQESDADRLRDRQSTAADLATAEAAELRAVQAHNRELEPLQARVAELRGLLDKAERDMATVAHKRLVESLTAGLAIDRLRSDLRGTASPAIAAFVVELRAALSETYKQRRDITFKGHDGKQYLAWSNRDSIEARADAIHGAINACGECGSILYAPLDHAALEAALDTLRASIPAIAEPPVDELRAKGVLA